MSSTSQHDSKDSTNAGKAYERDYVAEWDRLRSRRLVPTAPEFTPKSSAISRRSSLDPTASEFKPKTRPTSPVWPKPSTYWSSSTSKSSDSWLNSERRPSQDMPWLRLAAEPSDTTKSPCTSSSTYAPLPPYFMIHSKKTWGPYPSKLPDSYKPFYTPETSYRPKSPKSPKPY